MAIEVIPGICCCGNVGCSVCGEEGSPERIDIFFESQIGDGAVTGTCDYCDYFGNTISLYPLVEDPCVYYSDFEPVGVTDCYSDGNDAGVYVEIGTHWEVYILDNAVPAGIIAAWSGVPVQLCNDVTSYSDYVITEYDDSVCDWELVEPIVEPIMS